MRKIVKGAFIVATILAVRTEAQQSEQVTPPQKAVEVEGVDPTLWFQLQYEAKRAELFTHWERVHPHRVLRDAATPRVYERYTHSVDEITYELDGQRHALSHYLEKAKISGLMVLRGGQVRLEYYGKGLDAQSRNHIWSATIQSCIPQPQSVHAASCRRRPFQNKAPASISPPNGDMTGSGSGANQPKMADVQMASPAPARTRTPILR